MSAEIIDFVSNNVPVDFGFVKGEKVKKPKTPQDYQNLLKKFLSTEDYEEVLLCIMDDEYYESADPQIQNIVDAYDSFW